MTKDPDDNALGRFYRPAPKDKFKNLVVDGPDEPDWHFDDEPQASANLAAKEEERNEQVSPDPVTDSREAEAVDQAVDALREDNLPEDEEGLEATNDAPRDNSSVSPPSSAEPNGGEHDTDVDNEESEDVADAPAEIGTLGGLVAEMTQDGVTEADVEDVATSGHEPPMTPLAEVIKAGQSNLPEPETSNFREEWPKSVVKKLEAEAFNPKRPELGGFDLDSIRTGTENGGKLKSRLATELEPLKPGQGILGDFLADKVSVLIGGPSSKANGLALAIAKAVANGSKVLGTRAKPAPVLYVDPVRPEATIAAALGADRSGLGNLLILAKGTTDADVKNEIENLKAVGITLGLVVINHFGRIATDNYVESVLSAANENRYLLVLSEPKFKSIKNFRWQNSKVVDMAAREHVVTLEPYAEESVRLTVRKYGELVKDLAVDPHGNWKPLGKPEAGVKGKRQAAVLAVVKDAGVDGLEPKEIAALLDMTPGNAYQALFFLGRGNPSIVKKGKRYYAVGVIPKQASDEDAA